MRGPLAWIFWHSRARTVAETDYRAALLDFHNLLHPGDIEGFFGSRILRYDSLPWLPAAVAEVYEDWYFLRDSAALDVLEEAAIGARRKTTHDAVARLASTATAGLYRLRRGNASSPISRCCWLTKPAGESYESFFARFDRIQDGTFALFSRQMVLGPTPEFVLTASTEVSTNLSPDIELVPEMIGR